MAGASPNRGSRIEVALLMVLGLSLPFSDFPFFVWRRFGVDSSHVAGGLFLLFCLWRLRARVSRVDPLLAAGTIALMVVPLAALAFVRLSGFSAPAFWKTYLHLAFFLGIFLGIASSDIGRKQSMAVLSVLGAEAAILAAYGIYQVVALARGWPSGFRFLNRYAWHELRAQGFVWRATAVLEEPKWLALYLLAAIPYLYRAALDRVRSGRSSGALLAASGIAIIAVGIAATGSLGCIPIALLLLLLGGLDYFRRVKPGVSRRVLIAAAAAALVLIVGFFSLSRPTLRYLGLRIASETEGLGKEHPDYSSAFRYVENLRYGLAMFRESPLVGIGVGQFAPVGQGRGRELGYPTQFNRDGAWVGLGGLLAETGLFGLLAFLAILGRVGWPPLPGAGEPGDDRVAAVLLVLVVFLKETNAGFYIHFWTWFPLGIAALLSRRSRVAAESSLQEA